MPKKALKELTQAVFYVAQKFQQKPQQVEKRKFVVARLQDYVQRLFKTGQLHLFGSSCNGFGFCDSDIDLCMTFMDVSDLKGIKSALVRTANIHVLCIWH